MNKKVTISTKPLTGKQQKIINNWVEGKELKPSINSQPEVRFTVVLPENLYASLKITAVKEKKKLKELVASIVKSYVETYK